MGRRLCTIVSLVVLASLASACAHAVTSQEISRERAIEIARQQVTFEPSSVEAVRTTSEGRGVWRVTLRGRLPGQPPLLFETRIVEIDRRSGEVVSVARS